MTAGRPDLLGFREGCFLFSFSSLVFLSFSGAGGGGEGGAGWGLAESLIIPARAAANDGCG